MKPLFLFLALFTTTSFFAQVDLSKIDSLMNSKIESEDPGLFVGIVQNGEIIYEKYKGMASLQHAVKVDEMTRCNIASVAKQFTALMILKLSMDGLLSLEDDIRTYIPDLLENVDHKVKIRHLITHSSGIRDFYDLMSIQQDPWWKRTGYDNDDALEFLKKQKSIAFTPDSRRVYSNSGYTILTKIIEVASGEKFHVYSENFFKSLGMHNTTFSKNYMLVIPNQALPYSDWGDGVWKQYPMLTNLSGDGFLYTTLKDQLIYEKAVQTAQSNGDKLLSASQNTVPNSEIESYGFGLELGDRFNRKSVHHSGATGSYHAQTLRFPDEQLSIFVMSNNSRIWSGYIADEIAQELLVKKEKKDKYASDVANSDSNFRLSSAYGQYRSPNGYLIRIQKEGDQIMWRNANNNPNSIRQEKDNVFSFESDTKSKIVFSSNKFTLCTPDGETSDYYRLNEKEANEADQISYTGLYFSDELDIEFEIFKNNDKLFLHYKDDDWEPEVEILNRNELLVSDYILKIIRDQFDRVSGISLTTNRALNVHFTKKTNLIFQPTVSLSDGSISVTTIGSVNGESSQIYLTKNYPNGNEIWTKDFGGSSYDKASSIYSTSDGYLIVGSTSSYGNGNYDMFVIKTDKTGQKIWQNTYGGFYNEYGYSAEVHEDGYLIKGTIQDCTSNSDVFNRECTTNVWLVSVDKNGKKLSSEILEEINQ